jgi:hypothetical protein
MDKRSCGYRRRLMALSKAPEVMLKMIRAAIESSLSASYVLFDSWFSFPSSEFRSMKYDAVTAYVGIVFARYMILAVENRVMEDERTMCNVRTV